MSALTIVEAGVDGALDRVVARAGVGFDRASGARYAATQLTTRRGTLVVTRLEDAAAARVLAAVPRAGDPVVARGRRPVDTASVRRAPLDAVARPAVVALVVAAALGLAAPVAADDGRVHRCPPVVRRIEVEAEAAPCRQDRDQRASRRADAEREATHGRIVGEARVGRKARVDTLAPARERGDNAPVPEPAHNHCLHYVGADRPSRRMTISQAVLRALVEADLAAGKRPVRLVDHVGGAVGHGSFSISFDDAHRSMLLAAPVLEACGVRPTLFVPVDYVATSDDFLDWDELRALRDRGWDLGAHSCTHPRLSQRLYSEDEEQHRLRVRDEVLRSREVLDRELGQETLLFAYPYGEDPPPAREAVRAAGFHAAFTVRASLDWDGDLLAIPRLDPVLEEGPDVRPASEPCRFSVIVPTKDRVAILSETVTRLAKQSYPKDRYEVIVVDDGSTEDPTPIFREMPENVRLVRQGDREFRAGQARQRGAREARYEHLVFLDADVCAPRDLLWHHDWAHRRMVDAVLLGYLSGYNLHDLGYVHTLADVRGVRDLESIPIIPDRSREPALRRCLDNLDWLAEPWALTYTGHLSLPCGLFDKIGGFSDRYVGWGLEDIDFGLRLHRAGARFAFSRFAVGYHLVEPNEASRNPFREPRPTPERFRGYLENLAIFAALHAEDQAARDFVVRSRADVEETCARPLTVGIEHGGASFRRAPWHRRLHRVLPGGVPRQELLDRVEYAKKVSARTIFLLGGEPAEHPGFLDVVRASAEAVSWVSMRTHACAFAHAHLAEHARDAGLRGAVVIVPSLDARACDRVLGPGAHAELVRGLDARARASSSRPTSSSTRRRSTRCKLHCMPCPIEVSRSTRRA